MARCRTITRCPTTQNRVPVTLFGKVPGKKGMVPFTLKLYAQDRVEAEKARDFIPGLKDVTIAIEKAI